MPGAREVAETVVGWAADAVVVSARIVAVAVRALTPRVALLVESALARELKPGAIEAALVVAAFLAVPIVAAFASLRLLGVLDTLGERAAATGEAGRERLRSAASAIDQRLARHRPLPVPAEAPTSPATGATPAPEPSPLAAWAAEARSRAEAVGVFGRVPLDPQESARRVLANARDREALYARGARLGGRLHARDYADLAEKLATGGVCATARFAARDGETIADLEGTAATESPVHGALACHLEAGLLAGAVGNLEGRPMEARETACAARGDAVCRFALARAPDTAEGSTLYE